MAEGQTVTVLHAARLLDVQTGQMLSPGEVLVRGDRIVEAGGAVTHPAGAQTIDLGDRTLMPGLIDVHVHLFLHPGAEDLQTVEESVPQRTITSQPKAGSKITVHTPDHIAGMRHVAYAAEMERFAFHDLRQLFRSL